MEVVVVEWEAEWEVVDMQDIEVVEEKRAVDTGVVADTAVVEVDEAVVEEAASAFPPASRLFV